MNIIYSKPLFFYNRRSYKFCKPKCILDNSTISATISKLLSNSITYPLESYRLVYSISTPTSNIYVSKSKYNLYNGFSIYIPYILLNSVISYKIFFTVINCLQYYSSQDSLILGSICSSIISGFYKVPILFYIKNKVINNIIDFNKLYNNFLYIKAYLAIIMEDIPDMFIKFYLNYLIKTYYSNISNINSALIIALCSSILLAPVDFLKNKIFCGKDVKIILNKKIILLKILITTINTMIFFSTYNYLLSFKFI